VAKVSGPDGKHEALRDAPGLGIARKAWEVRVWEFWGCGWIREL